MWIYGTVVLLCLAGVMMAEHFGSTKWEDRFQTVIVWSAGILVTGVILYAVVASEIL